MVLEAQYPGSPPAPRADPLHLCLYCIASTAVPQVVYVVLEAQYQASLSSAVNKINTHRKEVRR